MQLQHVLTFIHPVIWRHLAFKRYFLPLLYSHAEASTESVELPACSGAWLGLFVSLCCCVSVTDRQDVRSILLEQGGGKPVTLAYLLWFESPHIPTHTLTHPVPAAALRMGVFHSKTLTVIFSSTSHSFTWNVCISRKGGLCLSYLMGCCCCC